ncbi:hypothetical protein BH20ACI4_BH20ACI4_15300 [soil metagenome]
MRCEDFREISDSFLSGELLVETNHEVVSHLEICESCRKELETQKVFREKLRSAVVNASDTQINPVFAANLRSQLKKDFVKENVQPNFWRGAFSLKVLTASFAALLLTAAITGFVFLADNKTEKTISQNQSNEINSPTDENLSAMWQKIAYQAIGDHRHCGLEKMDYWQKTAAQESAKKINFRENFLQKAAFSSSEEMKLLHVHDCIYDGRNFTHAVIQIGKQTVSVLLTETEIASEANKNSRDGEPDSAIICQKQTGFQIASFAGASKAVFVISDLPEAENLNLARSLSNVMNS